MFFSCLWAASELTSCSFISEDAEAHSFGRKQGITYLESELAKIWLWNKMTSGCEMSSSESGSA